jgi:ribosomal protein S27AE
MAQTITALEPDARKLVDDVLAELRKRGVKHDRCPRCEVFDWLVEPVAVEMIPMRGPYFPASFFKAHMMAARFVCNNCGYTMFHDLTILGLVSPT